MEIRTTAIADCRLLILDRFQDTRGVFAELYRAGRYAPSELAPAWRQINCSTSRKNVVRGIHAAPFAKLISCVHGRVFDVVVDLRPASPTYKRWVGQELTPENGLQVYVPPGCGHGFMALEDDSIVVYAQSGEYDPKIERTVHWQDEQIGIQWPAAAEYILSPRDREAPGLPAQQ